MPLQDSIHRTRGRGHPIANGGANSDSGLTDERQLRRSLRTACAEEIYDASDHPRAVTERVSPLAQERSLVLRSARFR